MPSSSWRPRSSDNHAYATAVELPDIKMVGFAPDLVTSVSRPPTNVEHWALYDFEKHAEGCSSCRDPYKVHRRGHRLCDSGHTLAQGVAEHVFSRRNGMEVYGTKEELVLVELPRGYTNVHSLLRAMERSLRHLRQPPIVADGYVRQPLPPQTSQDRTYYVAPRTPKNQHQRRDPHVARPAAPTSQNLANPSPEVANDAYTTELRTPKPYRPRRSFLG